MTIKQLVESGTWEEFYIDNKTGEKIPKTPEATQKYHENKPETKFWSSISQVKKLDSADL